MDILTKDRPSWAEIGQKVGALVDTVTAEPVQPRPQSGRGCNPAERANISALRYYLAMGFSVLAVIALFVTALTANPLHGRQYASSAPAAAAATSLPAEHRPDDKSLSTAAGTVVESVVLGISTLFEDL